MPRTRLRTRETNLSSAFMNALCSLLLAVASSAEVVTQKVPYSDGETNFEGVLVYNDSLTSSAPAILMAPNWMGVTAPLATMTGKAEFHELSNKRSFEYIEQLFSSLFGAN